MIGIPLGWITANAVEWGFHKYVLHGLGKKKGSFWAFHWHEHHRNVRKYDHHDPEYDAPRWRFNGPAREALALGLAATATLPLFPIAPFFTGTLVYCGARYWFVHRKSHVDPEWAKTHLPWHYDHHMGPDQDCNWCVTHPLFDHLMRTRRPFLDTAAARRRAGRDRASPAAAATT